MVWKMDAGVMRQVDSGNGAKNLNNMFWQICLNLEKWRFRLLPGQTEVNLLCAKKLYIHDMKKFGTSADDDETAAASEMYLCANCGLWLDGFCYKHPLLFVKEKTPIEKPYTHQATFPEFFYLNDSTIPKAGKGVFTNIPLPEGIAFGPYSGFVSTDKKAETSGYSWQIHQLDGSNCWVDAKNPFYSNWMRYVNCARFEGEQNFIALLYNRNIYYYTYKPVAAHQELMVWYGKDYGDYLKIQGALRERGPLAPLKQPPTTPESLCEVEENMINYLTPVQESESKNVPAE